MLPAGHTMRPSPSPHALLDGRPNTLHHLTITPPSLVALAGIPFLNLHALDHSAPPLDCIRHLLSSPADVDAQRVRKQLGRVGPFVTLKLPRLARREYGDNPLPIIRLELIWGVDEDEAQRALRVDGSHGPLRVQDVRADAGAVGRDVDAAFEEDDGLEAAARRDGFAATDGDQGWVVAGGGGGWWSGRVGACRGSFASDEEFGLFADGGEVLGEEKGWRGVVSFF
jgi:hypothetical protein